MNTAHEGPELGGTLGGRSATHPANPSPSTQEVHSICTAWVADWGPRWQVGGGLKRDLPPTQTRSLRRKNLRKYLMGGRCGRFLRNLRI